MIGKKQKKEKKDKTVKRSFYVLDFSGDIKATQVEQLRQDVLLLLAVATESDEVVLSIRKSWCVVNGYGFSCIPIQRIRDNKNTTYGLH